MAGQSPGLQQPGHLNTDEPAAAGLHSPNWGEGSKGNRAVRAKGVDNSAALAVMPKPPYW
jgi:hypothetical protein